MNSQIILPGLTRTQIELSNVVWLEGDCNYTRFHFTDGQIMIVSKSLRLYEASMAEDSRFVRTHKTAILNRAFIEKICRISRTCFYVQMTNGATIPIARSKKYLAKTLGK
jgi:two-component system, LytTR family, response regulator